MEYGSIGKNTLIFSFIFQIGSKTVREFSVFGQQNIYTMIGIKAIAYCMVFTFLSCSSINNKFVCTIYATNASAGNMPLQKCKVLSADEKCNQSNLNIQGYDHRVWRGYDNLKSCSSQDIKKFITTKY